MTLPMHPPIAREALKTHAEERAACALTMQKLAADLPQLVVVGKEAGLSMTEIARLAGVSRWTVYDVLGRPKHLKPS